MDVKSVDIEACSVLVFVHNSVLVRSGVNEIRLCIPHHIPASNISVNVCFERLL